MQSSFGIASFRSRTQVLRMEDALRRAGLAAGVISTPREVAMGCGLSVRFDLADYPNVVSIYRSLNPGYTPQNSAAYTPQWTASPYM